jgi:hypothetical protein
VSNELRINAFYMKKEILDFVFLNECLEKILKCFSLLKARHFNVGLISQGTSLITKIQDSLTWKMHTQAHTHTYIYIDTHVSKGIIFLCYLCQMTI